MTETLDGYYYLDCSRLFLRLPERCPLGRNFASPVSVTNFSTNDRGEVPPVQGQDAANPEAAVSYGNSERDRPAAAPPPADLQKADAEVSYGYTPFEMWGELSPEFRIRLRTLPHLKRAYERQTGRMLGRTRRNSIPSETYGREVWACVVENPSHGLRYYRLVWGDGSKRLGYQDIPGGNTKAALATERAERVKGWISARRSLEEIRRHMELWGV